MQKQKKEEAAWIDFLPDPRPPGHRTKVWCVVPRRDKETGGAAEHVELGLVKWHSPWRRYCFFPAEGTLFDSVCLVAIAAFCGRETLKQDHAARVRKRQAEIARKQKPLNPRDVSILGGDPSL